jgi:ubiquinone/menaquinone biosynthesis C-methylase UbiE
MDNNEAFWDNYVKKFETNPDNKKFKFLGSQWKGEQIFLELLKKYSNLSNIALEIGCGGGRVTDFAKNLFKNIIATDISAEMIRKASQDIKASNITWQQNNGFDLNEFNGDSLDIVYSHDVFVHFSSMQTYPYLRHIKRVLKPNGIGIISFYNFIKHFEIFKNESWRFNKDKIFPPSMRHHFITVEMITKILDDLNLEIVEIDTTNFLIIVFKKRLVS